MARRLVAVAVVQLIASSLMPIAARAQLSAVGPEFQVNTYTTNQQSLPRVAANVAGEFVVVWSSYGQDGSYSGVFGQRYSDAGVAQGPEFQVNTFTTSFQSGAYESRPGVAATPGGFVVVWDSPQDGYAFGVFARRYDTAGVAQGAEFQVNTYTTDNQRFPAVAADSAGNFVVVWTSYGQQPGFSSPDVFAQRYDSAGVAQGGEFQVNTVTFNYQYHAAVAMDPTGNFVVVWHDTNYGRIVGRRYNGAGVAQGGEFQVDSDTTPAVDYPAIDASAAGYIVAWEAFGQDGHLLGVFGQRYDGAGVAQGGEFAANTYTTGSQENADVAFGNSGDFVVTWTSDNQDGDDVGVFARHYDATGAPQGGELQVNTYTTFIQRTPAVAGGPAGRFVIAWHAYDQDGGGYGVFSQRYEDPLALPTTTSSSSTSSTSTSSTTSSSSSTSTTLPPTTDHLIPVKVATIKPARLFKFVARGTFSLPEPTDNPTVEGGVLSFSGTTGGQTYTLDQSAWTGLGPGGDGSRGFKFRGAVCKIVLIKTTVLKGVCRDDTGTFAVPETGDVDIVLSVGDTTRYCATCGGIEKGNPATVFKRKDCVAPVGCP